jgi:hypothetical protein
LWVSWPRRGSMACTSPPSTRPRSLWRRSSGNPMSTTRSSPACSAPGWRTSPTLGPPNVTVTKARTDGPRTTPVSPSTPEGMSTATIGTSEAFRASMASRCVPSAGPRNPVPKIASIAASALPSSRASRFGEYSAHRACPSCSNAFAAGPFSSSGSPRSIAMGDAPQADSCRAATSPSPALFPLPHTTTTRRPYVPPIRSTTARATARPARSISASTEVPRASVSRSREAVSAEVRTGIIRGLQPRCRTRWPWTARA